MIHGMEAFALSLSAFLFAGFTNARGDKNKPEAFHLEPSARI